MQFIIKRPAPQKPCHSPPKNSSLRSTTSLDHHATPGSRTHLSTSFAVSRRFCFSNPARTIIASAGNISTDVDCGSAYQKKNEGWGGGSRGSRDCICIRRGEGTTGIFWVWTDHITLKPLAEQAFCLSILFRVDHLGKEGKVSSFPPYSRKKRGKVKKKNEGRNTASLRS